MNDRNKRQLEMLKAVQKQKNMKLQIRSEKSRIINEIVDFEKHYRFADEQENVKINRFLDTLPALTSTRPLLNTTSQTIQNFQDLPFSEENIWICFLSGSSELIQIFTYGRMNQFAHDFINWHYLGSHILLICDDFHRFLFIDDNGKVKQSEHY